MTAPLINYKWRHPLFHPSVNPNLWCSNLRKTNRDRMLYYRVSKMGLVDPSLRQPPFLFQDRRSNKGNHTHPIITGNLIWPHSINVFRSQKMFNLPRHSETVSQWKREGLKQYHGPRLSSEAFSFIFFCEVINMFWSRCLVTFTDNIAILLPAE